MRTAQQQAVAWFTLSRGVLVQATLTSTQLKSVVQLFSVLNDDLTAVETLLVLVIMKPILVLIIAECVSYL
jgi:hypothetical protein